MLSSDCGFGKGPLGQFIGASDAFRDSIALICRFARSKAPVLISGETGTGKELAAHAVHYLSNRRDQAFIAINCGSLPDNLIESELFGHAKGAFTDAARDRRGLIREADGGTLFLDEVEALSRRGQVVLLRFLQDASFRAVGDERQRCGNVRVIAATNIDLHRIVDSGDFRSDLLFRLDVLSLELPPLRDRPGDISLLANHLLAKAAQIEGDACKTVSQEALDLLCAHSWPGNVRELEHVLLRAHLLSTGSLIDQRVLLKCTPALRTVEAQEESIGGKLLRDEKRRAVHEVESRFVESALVRAAGNISHAARLCGMERAAFSKLAKRCRQRLSEPRASTQSA